MTADRVVPVSGTERGHDTRPGDVTVTRDALARALYETDHGTNGYPPLHTSIPWDDLMDNRLSYARADRIIAKLLEVPDVSR